MTRAPKHRPERLAALIQEIIASALMTELKDPRVGFVTVTGVKVSGDGGHATVRVSVLGSDEDKVRAVEGLESARGFLRGFLARTLNLRTAPELHMELDRTLEQAQRIDRLLGEIRRDEPAS